jgi:hypothetical protein
MANNSDFRGLLLPSMRKDYVFGGNATFTLVSLKSFQRFTYKVKKSDFDPNKPDKKPVWFVSVLIGPDNWTNYKYAGLVNPETLEFIQTRNSKISNDAPSIFAFRWFLSNIESSLFELWHEGSCGICGRKLTVPESIASGIGPICASR